MNCPDMLTNGAYLQSVWQWHSGQQLPRIPQVMYSVIRGMLCHSRSSCFLETICPASILVLRWRLPLLTLPAFYSFSPYLDAFGCLCVFYVTHREKKSIFEREVYENEVYIHTYTCTYIYLRKKMRAIIEIHKHFFKR